MFELDEYGQCYVSTSKEDFIGWTLIAYEEWKQGVKRVYVTRNMNMFIVYAKDEHVEWLIQASEQGS